MKEPLVVYFSSIVPKVHLLVFIVCSVANCLKYYLLTLFVDFFFFFLGVFAFCFIYINIYIYSIFQDGLGLFQMSPFLDRKSVV